LRAQPMGDTIDDCGLPACYRVARNVQNSRLEGTPNPSVVEYGDTYVDTKH
jgi:hypothetical protein